MNPHQLFLLVIVALSVCVGIISVNVQERAKTRFEFVVSALVIACCLGIVIAASLSLYSK